MASANFKTAGSAEPPGDEAGCTTGSNSEMLDGHDYQQDYAGDRGKQRALFCPASLTPVQERGQGKSYFQERLRAGLGKQD